MCPHFNNNAKKCNLLNNTQWSRVLSDMGFDFLKENYCLAAEYVPIPGESPAGFSTCGFYKDHNR